MKTLELTERISTLSTQAKAAGHIEAADVLGYLAVFVQDPAALTEFWKASRLKYQELMGNAVDAEPE